MASSSRRSPGARRRPVTGMPTSSGVTNRRRARKNSPSAFCAPCRCGFLGPGGRHWPSVSRSDGSGTRCVARGGRKVKQVARQHCPGVWVRRSAALQQPCRRDHHRELRVLPGCWGSWAIAGDRLPHRGWGGRTETEAAQGARRQTTSYIALIQTQLIGDQLRGRPRDVLVHGCRSQADPRADTPTAVWLDHRKMPNVGVMPIALSSGRKCHAHQAI